MLIKKYSPKKEELPQNLLPAISVSGRAGIHNFKERFLEDYSIKNNISILEAYRRDKLIQDSAQECDFKAGDTVYPVNSGDYQKYGPCLVLNVAKDLKQYGNDTWPKSDNPFVVHLTTLKEPKQAFSCTSGWAASKNKTLKLAC